MIDPNRFRFRKVVRVLALALTFIKRSSKNLKNVQESNANIFRAWFKAWIISCVPLLMERVFCSGPRPSQNFADKIGPYMRSKRQVCACAKYSNKVSLLTNVTWGSTRLGTNQIATFLYHNTRDDSYRIRRSGYYIKVARNER